MLVSNKLKRVFLFNHNDQDIKLADLDESLSTEEVLNLYAQTYPVLTVAKVKGPEIIDDQMQYQFVPMLGTKG